MNTNPTTPTPGEGQPVQATTPLPTEGLGLSAPAAQGVPEAPQSGPTSPLGPNPPHSATAQSDRVGPDEQAVDPKAMSSNRPRPRTSPIVWGAIVLVFCVYCTLQLIAPGSVDSTTFLIATTIGLGLLLLIVGTAVIVRSSRNNRG